MSKRLVGYDYSQPGFYFVIELTDLDPTQAGPRAALLSPRHFLVDSRPKVANWEQSVKVATGTFSRWRLSTTAGMEL